MIESDYLLSPTQRTIRIDYERELNDQQLDVVRQGDGPVLVLAGAGSGKTRTITYRVAWLLEQGVDPSQILLLTFTNKAAKEMMSRVEHLLGGSAQGLWAGTFHSIANRLLRLYATKIGYESNFTISDQEDSRELIALCAKELKIDLKDRRLPSSGVLQELFSYARNAGLDVSEVLEMRHPRFLPYERDISAIAQAYSQYKKSHNVMDFDDLLLHLLFLLDYHPEVCERLAGQFRYVLVDEFQDTNHIQARIVQRLSSVHRNLFVVGDDAQSIYSFRAADIANILAFPEQYPDTKTFHLTHNYRSTPQILHVANTVIANNKKQFEKTLHAISPDGALPKFVSVSTQPQEAHYIADVISDLLYSGGHPNEIAVLFRAAFHSQALEFELMRRDIPYEYRGGVKFFERAHIKDAIAYMRLLHNRTDSAAWIRALRLHPGIGIVTAQKIASQAASWTSVGDIFSASPPGGAKVQEGWKQFLQLLHPLHSATQTPGAIMQAFCEHPVYRAYLEHQYPNAIERLEDLEQFIVFAQTYNDAQTFLDEVALTQEFGVAQDTKHESRLVLSTVHQAKGLEWDHVFIMNVAQDAFPHKHCANEEEVEEERRLFYVALTRARRNLHLTYPMSSGREYTFQQRSLFLDEISPDLLETVHVRPSGFGRSRPLNTASNFERVDDEPMVVLDADGEVIRKPAPSSFLRDLDDLGV